MKLIVCVEDRFGMLFNGRRLSRDCTVTERVLFMTSGNALWMNSYSSELFPADAPVHVAESFLETAPKGAYCFLENGDIRPYLQRVEELILFRWNRRYPYDSLFPFAECFQNWHLVSKQDFPGNSHETVTMEVYRP